MNLQKKCYTTPITETINEVYKAKDLQLNLNDQIFEPDDVLFKPFVKELKIDDQLSKREEQEIKLKDQLEGKVSNQEDPTPETDNEVFKAEDLRVNPNDQRLKPDDVLIKPADQRLTPDWINAHPNVPLKDLGFINFDTLQDFLKEYGKELKCLNLQCIDRSQMLDERQFEQLMKHCPNLNHVFINSYKISDKALEHLKGMPLTSVEFL